MIVRISAGRRRSKLSILATLPVRDLSAPATDLAELIRQVGAPVGDADAVDALIFLTTSHAAGFAKLRARLLTNYWSAE